MTKAEFIALAAQKWEEIEKERQESDTFFDYEKNFDSLWVDFGRQTLEGSLGDVPQDRRKKKGT